MIIYFELDDDGYLNGWGSTRSNENEIALELDEGHKFFNDYSILYKYVDGKIVKDEEKEQQLIDENEEEMDKPSELELLRQENEMLAMAVMELTATLMKGGD